MKTATAHTSSKREQMFAAGDWCVRGYQATINPPSEAHTL